MIGNIVIISITICLICYIVIVFGSELRSKTVFHLSGIMATLILVFTIIGPNIDLVKSPFTAEINGKVVDAITNQPISGATVILTVNSQCIVVVHH